jgi:membrane protease YdiL (CAAX protease family)
LTGPVGPGKPADRRDPTPADPAWRPGLRTFTVEGRAAPGLFVVGWIAFLMGAGALVVSFLAGVGQPARLLLALVGLATLTVGLVAGAGSQAIERRTAAERRIEGEAGPAVTVDFATEADVASGDTMVTSVVTPARAASGGYVGPSPFLVFAAALPLALLFVTIVGSPLVALGLDPDGPAATLLTVGLQAIAYVALIRLLVIGPGALSWRDMGLGDRVRSRLGEDIAWGVVLAVPVLVVTSLAAVALANFLPTPDSPLPPSGGASGVVLNFLAAAVVAPVGEELFFRGFATTAWARSLPIGGAILRGALFFAAVHVLTVGGTGFQDAAGRALVAFLTRLPVAIALGILFTRRGSLAAPIALHATFNGLLVLLAASVSVPG